MALGFQPPLELWTAARSAAADRHTMQRLGIPSLLLMERASLCVSAEIVERLAGERLPVHVLVGPGNNGGDGLAVARQLVGWGLEAQVHLVTPKHNDTVAQQLKFARALGVRVHEGLQAAPARAVLVDAMLGTGSQGKPRGGVVEGLAWARRVAGPKIAIDLPTGLDPDTGRTSDDVFRADVTVTFVRSKVGLHVTPGLDVAGDVVVADIGILPDPREERSRDALIARTWVTETLEGLPPGRHKGERGHVAIYGGSEDTPGAAVLAGTTALKAGAGLVTLVTSSRAVRAQLIERRPELMVAQPGDGTLFPAAKALVVGPGLTDPTDQERLGALWAEDARPAIWDASALAHVPARPAGGPRVLTPHPKEAAGLADALGLKRPSSASWSPKEVQDHRLYVARHLAHRTGAIVVLKGVGSLVAHPDGRIAVCTTGGPALATGGTGDCLAGLIGALLGRGLEAWEAAACAVHVHGVAGDVAHARSPAVAALDVAEACGEIVHHPRWATTRARLPARLRRG